MPTPARRDPPADERPWQAQDGLLRRVVATGARLLRVGDAIEAPADVEPPAAAPTDAAPASAPDPALARAAWSDRLWGDGMTLPGGAEEVLRLAALLPLTPAHTVLLAGHGARAAGSAVAAARGCFVATHDLRAASPAARQLPKRVTAAPLSPDAPAFRARHHHHAMMLEPFRRGGAPDAMLRTTATALRDGGEVVLLDLAGRAGASDARWLAVEDRQPPPSEEAMASAFERTGFRIHVVEDAGPRQQRAALLGWVSVLEALRGPRRPAPAMAAALVEEAEAWLLRLRLLRDGELRLLRWHATLARRPP
ncbi:hypothetical protein GXW78_26350 [Roseomonas terrae]|jgi:hypothetical protein|uniref:Class I SAM-dependent methyltransferase n=1 Tax=Neoroseomonas terrae TaxID=424799 RepID=A0ABS5EQB1_9PROT|nr:hypothetical protein [Neoroseomonas terrae]MBR0653204.1 hypothetical protein [Neoroseomonas terrae]